MPSAEFGPEDHERPKVKQAIDSTLASHVACVSRWGATLVSSTRRRYAASIGVLYAATLFNSIAPAGPISPEFDQAVLLAIDGLDAEGEVLAKLRSARKAYQRGDLPACRTLLEEAESLEPRLPPSKVILARFYFTDGRLAEGRVELERAAIEREHPELHLAFGSLAIAENRLADALLHYEKLIAAENIPSSWPQQQRDRLSIEALAGLALVYSRRQQWDRADELLSEWIHLDPESAVAFQRRAGTRFSRERVDDALDDLRAASKLDPTLEPAALAMAGLFASANDKPNAAAWFSRAVQEHPDRHEVYQEHAAWLFLQGELDTAAAEIARAAEISGDSRDILILSGMIARARGEFREASDIFARLYQESPGDPMIANHWALVLVEMPLRGEKALELAELNLRQAPNNPSAQATLGWIHFRQGRIREAEYFLRGATASRQTSSDIAYFLGRLELEKGNGQEARELFRAAVEADGHAYYRDQATIWLAKTDE